MDILNSVNFFMFFAQKFPAEPGISDLELFFGN